MAQEAKRPPSERPRYVIGFQSRGNDRVTEGSELSIMARDCNTVIPKPVPRSRIYDRNSNTLAH